MLRYSESTFGFPLRVSIAYVAIWTIATHLHADFEYCGPLYYNSANPQSGKTQALKVHNPLVFNSSGILISPTEAGIFRTASGYTQIIDELDACLRIGDMRAVLNAGFNQGAIVSRFDKNAAGSITKKPSMFHVYAPRILAGITSDLHRTLFDRMFKIQMQGQKRSERVKRFRSRDFQPKAKELHDDIVAWTTANRPRIIAAYDAPPAYLDRFTDRTIDVSEPLAAVLEVMYADHPELTEARIDLLEAITLTRKESESPAKEYRLLMALAELAKDGDLIGTATELAIMLNGLQPSETEVSEALRRHDFETKSARLNGDEPRKRYVLPYAALSDIAERCVGSRQDRPDAPNNALATTPQPLGIPTG